MGNVSFYFKRVKYVNKPFNRLTLKQRAIFILTISGFTQREIAKLLKTSLRDVNQSIADSFEEYTDEMVTYFERVRGQHVL